MKPETIAISSTFTVEPVAEVLQFWMEKLHLSYSHAFAPFNQVFQQLLDPTSLLATNAGGINVLLVRLEDWDQHASAENAGAYTQGIERNSGEFVRALKTATERTHVPHVVIFCPPSQAYASTAAKADALRQFEARLAQELNEIPRVQCTTSAELLSLYPVAEYDDPGAERLGKIPYTRTFFSALGTAVCRAVHALRNAPYKVLVLDCDQTLWKGVCGEVGAAGVEIDAHRRHLQDFALQQHDAGMLLCLASKNDERDVDAVFQHHAGMPLKPEHIVARRINWKPKSENLKSLAAELNLSLDSFILIDDNPIECSEVESHLPGVLALQLPENEAEIPQFLRGVWAFTGRKATREDKNRTQLYQENAQRERERSQALTFADFLARLELQVNIAPLQAEHLARVAQLTQRTNQFNATTIRRSESELQQLCASHGHECLVVDSKDRFGDYGLVGAVIYHPGATTLRVDTLLLSCRALGRGIEHRMMARLGEIAVERSLDVVEIAYVPTERNEPARLFLESIAGAEFIARPSGFVCRVPAALAAKLAFNGESSGAAASVTSPVTSDGTAILRSEEHDISQATTLKRIAVELRSADQILAAVDRWKRRMRPELGHSCIAPRNDRERKLARIWEDVLGIDRIGIHDNFFELGGNSILGTLLINKIGDNLSLHLLFEAPTIAEQAEKLKFAGAGARAAQPTLTLPRVVPDPQQRFEPFPMTDTQQAYWIGRSPSLELGNIGCHIYEEVDVEGLDLERFKLALQRLVERHDMLRAVILPDGRQQILKQAPAVVVQTYDLRGADVETVDAHFDAVRKSMSHQMLPTDRAPMLQFRATILDGGTVRLHRSTDRIISDALSDRIMVADLHALYQNPNAKLKQLELSFRDYVLGEIALTRTEQHARSQEYWLKKIPLLPPPPELPLARSSGMMTQPRFCRHTTRIDRETWQRFKHHCAHAGVTPPVALLGAYADVLASWSKNRRFSLNLTVMNRFPLHPQVSELLGDGTSVSILAVEPDEKADFTARARTLQSQLWDDLDHRYFSGVKVLRELVRAGGGTPRAVMPVVFTSTLNLDELGGKDVSWSKFGKVQYGITQTAQVWLDNQVYEEDGELGINWDAVEGLFPDRMLDDMFDAYVAQLERLADDAHAWQGLRRTLTPQYQLEQRDAVNSTEEFIPPGLLHTPFAEQAARQPDHPAVIGAGRTLTYRELMNCATGLAQQLRLRGVGPNELVAVVMEKGWEQVVAVLGVLQSGGAYLPIDSEMPRERLAYLLDNAQVRVVLTTAEVNARISLPAQIQRIIVDASDAQTVREPLENVQSPIDLAYVIYTSGSTGRPKGVMIDHRGALNTIVDMNRRFRVRPEDRVLALSSLSFDLSVYDVFGMLAAGATVVMPEKALSREPSHWFERIKSQRVTIWNTVPTLMEMLANHVSGTGEVLPPELRVIMMSGDWIPISLPPRLKTLAKCAEVYSLGGATEASIWSIIYPIETIDPAWKSVPYGKPMVNQTFNVLNDALEPCPVWVPGNLYIGGIGLAKGYWRDPEKTGKSFIEHPLTGERLYRTGDMGRYLPDGNIEFLGRVDHQVKIRGFRIELGEIEAALAQHPAVKDAVVIAREDAPGEKRLVAYVVSNGQEMPTVADWRGYLREKVPDYMVPAAFVALEKFPLSSNGKVDRKALPAPDHTRPELGSECVAPRTPVEETLAAIWCAVLNVKRVGIHDNFFDLGGDSILATQALARITQNFAAEVNLFELFEQPTIAGLAETITRKQVENIDPEDLARILGELEELPEGK